MAFVAGQTETVRLLTSVLVLPHRSPVPTAEALASLDYLSGGRLSVGCGAGWMKEEFEAVGAPPHPERGRVADEYILVFKELWTNDDPEFHGDYADFSNITFEPETRSETTSADPDRRREPAGHAPCRDTGRWLDPHGP